MPTYSSEDFERIAAAIGVDPRGVARCLDEFEAAAAWYRSDCRTPRRVPPSTLERQAKQIAAAARRLLRHLEIYDYRNAHEGPSDLALLEALALAEDGSEAEAIQQTEREPRGGFEPPTRGFQSEQPAYGATFVTRYFCCLYAA